MAKNNCACGNEKDCNAKKCKDCKGKLPESKICLQCKKELPIDSFRLRIKGAKLVLYAESYCKECEAENRAWTIANTETGRKGVYRRNRRNEAKDPEKKLIREVRSRCKALGLSHLFEEILELEKNQINCTICGIERAKPGSLHIDHDHMTGEFRGLICQQCNHGLGMFKDNPAHLQAAIEYLNKPRKS